MLRTAQKRNAKVPASEAERDVRDALKMLRQEERSRKKAKA